MRTFAGMLVAIAAMLVCSLGTVRADAEEASANRIEASLESKTLAVVSWDETPISDVMRQIARETGVNILIDTKNVDVKATLVTMELTNLPARAILDIVLKQHKLIRLVQDGVIYVTIKDSKMAKPKLRTKIYDIRDVTMKIRDFAAPEISLGNRDRGSSVVIPNDDKDPPSADDIAELVEENVEPDIWGNDGHALKLFNGQLVVTTSNEVHRKIRRFISQLRAAR